MSDIMMNDPHGIAMAAKEKINVESFRALQDLVSSPMCIPYTVRCDSYAHRDLVRDGLATCRKSSDALGEFDLIEITEAGHALLSQIKTENIAGAKRLLAEAILEEDVAIIKMLQTQQGIAK